MHIANLDDLIDIHIIASANFGKLIGKGDINIAEGVFYDLSHLSSANAGNGNLALAKRRIEILYALANFLIISTNGSVVVRKLRDHVSRNNTLWCMYQMNINACSKTFCLN